MNSDLTKPGLIINRLVGNWVLNGVIAGQETTHDIDVEWVLNQNYVRIHEVSREQDDKGHPAYEAMVFIGWDRPSNRYACLWLDSTTGDSLAPDGIGYALPGGDEIAILFTGNDGSLFHTTFTYNPNTDAWQWAMDNEQNGKRQPFARLSLTRK